MSVYKGTTLIAGSLPDAANQDLSNLSQTGQAVIDGKADTDLSNVPTTKGILTESYDNSGSWYRVYSDGWCEQGGVIGSEGTTRGKTQSISFAKPFRDRNYTIIAVDGNTSKTSYTSSVAIATILNSTKSETGVSIGLYGFAQNDVHGVINWVAYGYIS